MVDTYHKLALIPNIDEAIMDAISQGRSMLSIAEQYGVHDTAILRRVQKHPDYKEKLKIGLELRMDLREAELELAATNVDVTRQDRLLGHARWLAERQLPEQYGAGQKIMGADGQNLVIEVVQFGRTIEHEA